MSEETEHIEDILPALEEKYHDDLKLETDEDIEAYLEYKWLKEMEEEPHTTIKKNLLLDAIRKCKLGAGLPFYDENYINMSVEDLDILLDRLLMASKLSK